MFDSSHEETFDPSKVSSVESTATCPPLEFTVTDQSGNALPSPLFMYDLSTQTLTIETDDVIDADLYNLRLNVAY